MADKSPWNFQQRLLRVILTTDICLGNNAQPSANMARSSDCDCSDCACTFSPPLYTPNLHLSFPITYALELTPRCNNRCPGCFNTFVPLVNGVARQHQDQLAFLDSDGWERVLDIIAPHATHLKLTGGEPTLHPQFHAVLHNIANRGIPFTLFTNGRWCDPQSLVTLLSSIPTCTGMLISLHGAAAESHETFSGVKGSFSETLANIRLATAAGLNVALSTVITRQNYHQIYKMLNLGHELGVDHVVFNRYLGPSLPGIEPTEAQLTQAVATISKLQHRGEPVRFGNCIPQCFFPGNTSAGCSAGISYCAIDPMGNLRPCAHDGLMCGNILEQPLEAIWNGPAMQTWRNSIPEACRGCAAVMQCRAGCLATARMRGGTDPLMGTPLSEVPESAPTKLVLYEKAAPVKRFILRQESFGSVVVRDASFVVVPSGVESILTVCDGQTTLRQIKQRFGGSGLAFIGELYQRGLVELVL